MFFTPLVRIKFWRVIVDEAQMIGSTTSEVAQMANHLHMVNRWCVTGTPISRGLDDIFGLLMFLKVRLNTAQMRPALMPIC